MKAYIVVYSHKHGITTWPEFQDDPLTVDDVIEGLTDWRPEEESITIEGPFPLPTPAPHPAKHYQVELLRAALTGLFDQCAMMHKHWGENSNQREADAAIESARRALEATK